MGGFLLIRREPGETVDRPQHPDNPALVAFAKKGLKCGSCLVRDDFVLHLYQRLRDPETQGESTQLLEFPDGDFIAMVGTGIYKGRRGDQALQTLFDDFTAGIDFIPEFLGAFCVLVYHRGQLSLFTDYLGYYRIYQDLDQGVISSSFLAVAAMQSDPRLVPQALYEYLFFGFLFHRETLLSGVEILDSRRLWHLTPRSNSEELKVRKDVDQGPKHFPALVETIADNLLDYFKTVGLAFDNSFTSALSGGYDSRLVFAAARKLGQRVNLYVYGSEGHEDVVIARRIAAGEGLDLDHVDKSKYPQVSREEYPELLTRQFHFFDGLKAFGIFDNGSDLETRLSRTSGAELQISGAGGEIYREVWSVANQRLGIRDFVSYRYCRPDLPGLTDHFDEPLFHDNITTKVKSILEVDRNWMNRRELELLFPLLRNKFAAQNNVINNQIASALLPYMEPRFIYQSAAVPLKFKYHGRLQSALIHYLDPALASYPSTYGPNFTDRPPLLKQLKTSAKMHLPLRVKRAKRMRSKSSAQTMPWYLERDLLSETINFDDAAINEYVDLQQLQDPLRLSRALTVELLLAELC
jgi:hypothetical protein